jgi:hypothetical protein
VAVLAFSARRPAAHGLTLVVLFSLCLAALANSRCHGSSLGDQRQPSDFNSSRIASSGFSSKAI